MAARSQTLPEGRRIDLPRRGAAWILEVEGPSAAPTVVLLHGLGATGLLNWFPSFGPLSEHYNVVAIDHRGHGRGINGRRPFKLEDCADDVAVLIDELGIGNAIVVGYSMGGPITQLTWHRHPEVVRGVVLCATSYRFGPADRRLAPVGDAMSLGLRFTPRLVRQQMVRGMIGFNPRARQAPEWVAAELRGHDPAAVVEAAICIRRFDSTPWIEDIDVPAASVITDFDRLVPPRRQEKLAQLTNGEVFHVRGGHDACVMRADRFVPALVSAIDSVAKRSA